MKRYRVILARAYQVTIKAESEEKAKIMTEYFLGNCPDLSNKNHRREKKFYFEEIKQVQNDALEACPIRR